MRLLPATMEAMDDDIRDRFRGVARRDAAPRSSGRAAAPPPKPLPRSAWPAFAARPKPAPAPAPRPAAAARPAKRRRRRKSGKKLLTFLVVVLLLAGSAGGYAYYKRQHPATTPVATPTPAATPVEEAKPTGTVRFIATGDNLAFDSINTAAKQADGTYNYLPMMAAFDAIVFSESCARRMPRREGEVLRFGTAIAATTF